MALALRPYQLAQLEEARDALRRGIRRILLQAPTGAGKTCTTAHLLARAVAKGLRAWFICHRRELVQQSSQTFREAADLITGVVAAGSPMLPLAPVQVCSVQTLIRRHDRLPTPQLLVWDECHHLAAQSWKTIADAYPDAFHLGLTATPCRLDGRGLRPFFDHLIPGPSTADLIQQGYLSPYRLFAPTTAVDLTHIRRIGGDYERSALDTVMSRSTVTGDALTHYQRHCPHARALLFLWSIPASRDLVQRFQQAGITAAHLDGDTPSSERMRTVSEFRAGRLQVLSNVDLFGEGFDVPAVDAVFLLRPTQSLGLYLQQIGRGLRPAAAKTAVAIFDHAGNWTRHGLPDDDREWSLEGTRRPHPAHSETSPRRCLTCFAVSPAHRTTCVVCGAAFPRTHRHVETHAADLSEHSVTDLKQRRQQLPMLARQCRTLTEWYALAQHLGYKRGWGWYRWRDQQRRRSCTGS